MSKWDAKYAEGGALFGDAPNDYVRAIVGRPDFSARSALCLADGDGRNGSWLAAQGISVTAVDFSKVATDLAVARDARAGVCVERIIGDLGDWSLGADQRFDAVFLIYLQSEWHIRKRAMRIGVDALRPGGWLVIEVFAKAGVGRDCLGPDNADLLYDLSELKECLPDLQVVERFAGEVVLDEGVKHQGVSEIIRFAGRRN